MVREVANFSEGIPSNVTVAEDSTGNVGSEGQESCVRIESSGGESLLHFEPQRFDRLSQRFDAVSMRAVVELLPGADVPQDVAVLLEYDSASGSGTRINHAFNVLAAGAEGTLQTKFLNDDQSTTFIDERFNTRDSRIIGVPMESELLWDWTEGRLAHRMQGRLAARVDDDALTNVDQDSGPFFPQVMVNSNNGTLGCRVFQFELRYFNKLD